MDVGALQRYQEELERSWNNIGERISWGAVFVSLRILSANCQGTTKIRYLYLGARHILWIKIGQTGTLMDTATYCDIPRHSSHLAWCFAACSAFHSQATRPETSSKRLLHFKSRCITYHGRYDRYESIGNQQIWLQRPKNKPNASKCHLLVHHIVYLCFGKHTLHSGKSMKSW